MNIIKELEGIVNSDLGKKFTEAYFPSPVAVSRPMATVQNPAEPKKDYFPWIIGGVAALVVSIGAMIYFASKKK